VRPADTTVMSRPTAPADLFDLDPNQPAEPARSREAGLPSSVPWIQMSLAGALTLGVGLPFSFPPLTLIGLPLGAAVSQLLRGLRLTRRIVWVSIAAAVAAQVTDVFVSPFSWSMRFGFFAVMLGAGTFYWGLRMDEFADR
jgi:hypothetical protein